MMKSSIVGRRPPTSTLRPPDVIHMTSVPRPSPFFALFLPPCIILNANQRTKNGVGLGMRLHFLLPGNGMGRRCMSVIFTH